MKKYSNEIYNIFKINPIPQYFSLHGIANLFVEEGKDFKKKLINYIGFSIVDLYLPIYFNNDMIVSGFRTTEETNKKISLFPSMKGETVLDLGCNTGYIDFSLQDKVSSCTCIDMHTSTLFIPYIINCRKRFENLEFINIDIESFIKFSNANKISFDNVLCMGVYEFHNFNKVLPELLTVTKNRLIVEIANHSPQKTKKEIKEYVKKLNVKAEIIDFLEYQHRPLLLITV